MKEQQLDKWWWSLNYTESSEIAFNNGAFADNDDEDESLPDLWWCELTCSQKLSIYYEMNK
jgi:hypothetical protein